jgi:PAS domain S-box-containing protein
MKPTIDTILIIEDDPGLIELINEKVQECGHPTICFRTAATAFEWLENNTPILMILDYSLPDMNAQQFVGTLKNEHKIVAPFIVATGQGDERIAVEMMKLGAKEYIIKDTHFLEMVPLIVSKSISEIEKGNKLLLTEQKIVELSQFNKQIIESAHEGIIVYDKDLNYLTWNPFMEKITGIPAIDVIGKNAIELFPFLQNSGEAVNIRKAIEEKKITETEFEFNVTNTGKFGWVSQTSGPLFNFEGEVIGAIATIHDVTKRKKAEEDLRFSEEKFRSITEQIDDYISISDINGIIFYASPAAKAMFGYEPNEITGHHFMDFIDEEYLQKAVDAFQNGIAKKKKAVNLELKLKRKDGSTFFGELNGNKIKFGNEPRILVVVRDISERKKAEIALELTKQSYVDIINSVSEAIYVLDENATFIDVNKGAREMYQLSNEELIGKTPADVAAPGLNNLKNIQKSLQNVFKNGVPATFEFWAVRKNGEVFPKEVIVNKGRYFEKDVLVATARDITERKAAQHEIDKIGKHYQALIENAPDGIVLISAEGQFKYASPSARRLFGYTATEELTENPNELTHPDDLDKVMFNLSKLFTDPTYVPTIEYRFIDKSGNWKWVETTFTNLLADPNVSSIVLNFKEITERKNVTKELLSSEEKYRTITENISDVVWTADTELNLTFISSSVKKLLLETPEEHILRSPHEKFTPASFKLILDELKLELELEKDPTIKKDRIHIIEVEHYKADGSIFWAELRMSFLRDEASNITGMLGVTRDITERKLAELQINKLNNCFLTFGSNPKENMNQLVKVCGELFNSTCAVYNRIENGMLSIFGSWNVPDHLIISVHPEGYISTKVINEKSDNIQIFRNLKNSDFAITDPVILKYGIETYIGKSVKFGKDNAGSLCVLFEKDYSPSKNEIHLLEIIASAIGVEEERMQVQKVLEVSEEKYRTMIEYSNDWIWLLDKHGCFTFVNKTTENATGLSAKDWIGRSFIPLALEEDLPMLTDVFHRSMNGEVCSYELRFKKTDSSILTILVNTSPIYVLGEVIGMISFGQDITERKRAENALLTSETRLRKALVQSSGMIQSNDDEIDYQRIADSFLEISGAKYLSFNIFNDNGLDFTTVAVSGIKQHLLKFTSILGYEVVNKKWKYDPVRAPKMEGNMICIFESLSELTSNVIPKPISTLLEKTFNIGEVAIVKITKNNTAVGDFTLVYPKGETLENPELIELFANQVGLFVERKKAEKALNESEGLYRNLVQRIPDGVYKSTPDGRFVDVNPAMVKMFGYTNKDELLNLDINNELYFDENHRETVMLNTINEEITIFQLRKKDGSNIWVEDHGWYNFDENGRKTSNEGVLRDITERKKAEESLTEKMDELMRFHRLMVGRELTMIELKKEVNNLLRKAGEVEKYKIVE